VIIMNNGTIYRLSQGIEPVIADIEKDFPEIIFDKQEYLRMFKDLVRPIEKGTKTVTIRYCEGKVRIPVVGIDQKIKIMQTTPEKPYEGPFVASIQIPQIFISKVKDFPLEFARLDGYNNKEEMIQDISGIYLSKQKRLLRPDEVLSMYWIENFKRIWK